MVANASDLTPALSVALEPHRPSNPASRKHPGEFFRFRFGCSEDSSCNVFPLAVETIGSNDVEEVWYTDGPLNADQIENGKFVTGPHYLAAHLQIEYQSGHDLSRLTDEAYSQLIDLARHHGYSNLLRVWNFIPDIAAGDGDGEAYKQFSRGRAAAFGKFGYTPGQFPAATAIGTAAGSPVSITLLATNVSCMAIENPRQISAYHYPRQFGPISPSFSRAVVVNRRGGQQLLLSGTASIVGYQSFHDGNVLQQCNETVQNIDTLVEHAAERTGRELKHRVCRDSYLRVYVREPETVDIIRAELRRQLDTESKILFLKGDMCRKELLLEIESNYCL